ncbi:unnamed protein product, partial [Ectocarpus sp. 8 AP-2014]
MFIIQLRGKFGRRIQLAFFLLVAASFVSLYFGDDFGFELLVGVATLASYFFALRYLRRNPEKLEFIEGVSEVVVFPNYLRDGNLYIVANAVCLLPFPYAVENLLTDAGFSTFKFILVTFSYFAGSLGVLGCI